MKPRADRLIVTCEHGGNRVPARYRSLFARAAGTLRTHRGWDPGALPLARRMARALGAPLDFSTVSRLVVDLNRSETHPRVVSRWTAALLPDQRERLLERFYRPFRRRVAERVSGTIRAGNRAVHVSVHSFTPVLGGVRRNADIGLLYDPRRLGERALAAAWRAALARHSPALRIRMNYPYLGTSDGHTTSLRGRFQPDRYVGIELEISQRLVRSGARWKAVQAAIVSSLAEALVEVGRTPAAGRSRPSGRKRALRP